MKKFSKFLQLTSEERLLLIAAIGWLGIIRVGLKFLPFQSLRNLLARFSRPVPWLQNAEQVSVEKVVWAVKVASPYLRAVCLPQALATQVLLAQRGYSSQLRIGFTRNNTGQKLAHAWVEYQGKVVIGDTGNMASYILVPLSDEKVRDAWQLFT